MTSHGAELHILEHTLWKVEQVKKRGAFSSLGSLLTGQGVKNLAQYGTMWLKSILPDVDFPASPTPACPAKHVAVKVKVRQDTERLERDQFVLFTCPYRFHSQPRGTPPGHNLRVHITDKSANFKLHLILLCTWMMSIVEGRLTRLLMFASIWISKTCKHEIKRYNKIKSQSVFFTIHN